MEKRKDDSISITQTEKGKTPRLPYLAIKNSVLGKSYVLSLAFVGDRPSRKLNRIYRNINKPANVLSFPLSSKEGEILINLKQAKHEAKGWGRNTTQFVGFLFIHALMHLKGFTHSSRMESEEKKIRNKYNV